MTIHRSAAALVGCLGLAAVANAQPNVNGATLHTRVFNDFPNSTLGTTNAYPGVVQISDGNLVNTPPSGFANLHNWHLSANGGASDAVFNNGDMFSLFADVSLTGTGQGELGLQVAPWWSQNVDGRFNLRSTDGEVAVFGGRLPFYSFTAAQGVHYVGGTTVRIGIEYNPNGLSSASPAQIRYTYGGLDSGWLNFDEGNPMEPYGTWGMLDDARVGGYMQVFGAQTGTGTAIGTWGNISYVPAPSSLALLAAGGLLTSRRRRRA